MRTPFENKPGFARINLTAVLGVLLVLSGAILLIQRSGQVSKTEQSPVPSLDVEGKGGVKVETLIENGGRLDVDPDGERLAYDRKGKDGYFDVWVTELDDPSVNACLTCENPDLPLHNGNPAWHPTGRYIVFQAQHPELKGIRIPLPRFKQAEKFYATPGVGVNNVLWAVDSTSKQAWQLTEIAERMATLHPHFSAAGDKLLWAEMEEKSEEKQGIWAIKTADFAIDQEGVPKLSNVRSLKPGNLQFYETHGWFDNDGKIIFSAQQSDKHEDLDIYSYDLQTEELQELTDPTLKQWDEHAHVSPDESRIIWLSSMGIEQDITQSAVEGEYWMMDIDGSNKQRLTYFNDPTASEYITGGNVPGDFAWHPNGDEIVAYVIHNVDQVREDPFLRTTSILKLRL